MFQQVRRYFNTRLNRSDIRSKSGGMLVLSLLLMAVGVILITSAMSVTISARQRFYVQAQSAQARLTATSTAKALAEAITLTQEIDDTTLEAWANTKSGTGLSSAYVLEPSTAISSDQGAEQSSGAPMAPGLIPSSTITKVYWTDSSKNKIALDVTTNVDASGGASPASERVVVTLKVKDVAPPIDAFHSPLLAGGDAGTGQISQIYVANNLTGKTDSSYVVLRGEWYLGSGDALQSKADVVFTGPVGSANGITFSNDINLIFYGDKAGVSATAGNGFRVPGYAMFLGLDPTKASVMKHEDGSRYVDYYDQGWVPIHGVKGMYFLNTYYKGYTQGMADYSDGLYVHTGSTFVDRTHYLVSGNRVDLGATETDSSFADNTWVNQSIEDNVNLKSVVDFYTGAEFSVAANRVVKSTAEAVAMTGYSEAVSKSGVDLTTRVGTDQELSGPSYFVNVSSASSLSAHWTMDLAGGDITIYLVGSGEFSIGSTGLIEFTNGGSSWGKIILAPGVHLNIEKNVNTLHGIISTDREIDDIKANLAAVATANTDYMNYKPFLYLLGVGGNRVHLNMGGVLEAYVGLYGNPDKVTSDTPGSFGFSHKSLYVGRVESINFYNLQDLPGYDNGQVYLPYILGPGDPIVKPKQPLVSKYEVESYQYLQPVLP